MEKIIFVLILLVLISANGLAWNDCPYGEVLCEGKCGLFIDTDNDRICDHCQLAPEDRNNTSVNAKLTEEEIDEIHELVTGKELKTKNVNEIAEIYQINATKFSEKISEYLKTDIKPEDSFQFLHDNYGLEPNIPKDIATAMRVEEIQANIPNIQNASSKQSERIYYLMPISMLLIMLYLITFISSKKKIISVVNHKKIWNILLLISFLISGLLGILLIIKINFGTSIILPFNILFWHVEAGIVMFVICIFHIIEHWHYFKKNFCYSKS